MSTQGSTQGSAGADAAAEIRGWCLGRLPHGGFTGPREAITVIGELTAAREGQEPGEGAAGDAEGEGEAGADVIAVRRSRRLREETREARIGIAREAERRFGRKVSWGVVSEGRKVMFT